MTEVKSTNIHFHAGNMTRDERWAKLGATGCTVWFTGLSGSGKSTVASAVEQELLIGLGKGSFRLDGDNVRFGLNSNLGFSPEDRTENIRRIGEVAKLMAESGQIVVTSFISPYRKDRDAARETHEKDGLKFFEVFVSAPLDECEKRDPKGLYKKARAGEIKGFTGIDAPYEEPEKADLVLNTADESLEESVKKVVEFLKSKEILA